MRQGPDFRTGTAESRARRLPPAFWLAQGCIGLAMVFLAFRPRGAEHPAVHPPERSPRQKTVDALLVARLVSAPPATGAAVSLSRPGRSALVGIPYPGEDCRSELRVEEDSVRWTLDPRELAWLLANRRQVLSGDLQTDPEPEGGLRVKAIRQGSFGERRGLRVGDVLLDINGQELDSPSDLEEFLGDPGSSGAGGWRVRLRRGQDVLLLDYRSAS